MAFTISTANLKTKCHIKGRSMDNKVAVDIANVTKVYGSGQNAVTAIKDVNLQIYDNEFLTLLGPSGCGKTTLLRMIAGFEGITSGRIMLFEDEIESLPPNQRPVNTVFQHYALFPHLTVYENVAFGLRRQQKSAAEIDARCREVLALTQMEALADRKPSQMSGGQQQRVALARALAPTPKVLLLDEPLSALDLKLRQAMREELKQLQQKTGITFIFVTHDQEEALAMSDRIAVMSEGQVQQTGTPETIYERPANRFVANFIGEANLLAATCKKAGQTAWFDLALGGSLQADAAGISVGDKVTIMVRPERVRVHHGKAKAADGNNVQLAATVTDRMYLGSVVHFDLACGNQMLKACIRSETHQQLAPGETVTVDIPVDGCRILQA
jgi:spermidine/putrescine transport system ATP-binding protein